MARGEQLGGCQRVWLPKSSEPNPVRQHLTKVYLPAFQQCQDLSPLASISFDVHVGIALRVALQEL